MTAADMTPETPPPLSRPNLSGADLYRADLSWADLTRANLYRADLYRANLTGANLARANLARADLAGAKIEFQRFPSIRLLSAIPLGELSDQITLELMRRDAYAHPEPDKFTIWAKQDGLCPYQNEERFWYFQENKELWKAGKPKMRDSDLIIAICKEKGWRIKGYLE